MAEELQFGVTLEDHMSGPAQDAAKSLHELAGGAEHGKGLIDELTKGMVHAVEPAEVLKGAFEGVGAGMQEMLAGFKSGEAKEVVAGVTESLAGLAQMLDLLVPGLGQAAAALIKFTGAAAGALVGLAQSGAELAIEATTGKLAMIDMFDALGGGHDVGVKVEEMLSDLSKEIGITKDSLAPLTRSFMAMGIEGDEALRKVTLAAASARAIMGDPSAAHAFESLTKKIELAAQTGHGLKIPEKGLKSLADMGLRVDDVASRMGKSSKALADELKAGTVNAAEFGDALQDALIDKGAKPLDRMGKSLANMKKIFGQEVEDMFEDMDKSVLPFLDKLKDVVDLFDQGSIVGQTLKMYMGETFGFILDQATNAIEPIEIMFIDLLTIGVKTHTLFKAHWGEIKDLFIDVQGPMSVVQHLLAAMAKSVEAILKVSDALKGAKEILTGHGGDIGTLGAAAQSKTLEGQSVAGKAIGNSLAGGLEGGMADAIPAVKAASEKLADAATGGVSGKLEVHSPSRVFYKIGSFSGEGMVDGLQDMVPRVGRVSSDIGEAAAKGANDNAGGAASGSSSAIHGGIHITIQAPNGVTHATELTEVAVAALFERLALTQGLAA